MISAAPEVTARLATLSGGGHQRRPQMIGALGLVSVCGHIEHASRVNDWTSVKASMANGCA
jgi:hypothetical protein